MKKQDVKILRWKLRRRIETFVLIQNESRKIKIAREMLYEGDRVVEREWGKARKDWEDVRCEDVTQTLLHTAAFTHRPVYTDAFTQRRFYTEAFTHRDLLQTSIFTHIPSHTFSHKRFTHGRVYTETFLHRAFAHWCSFCTHDAFSHSNFYTQTLLYTKALFQADAFTQRRFYTDTITHSNFYTEVHFR